MKKIKNIAVILTWWKWSRFNSSLPKQFTKLAWKTILEYTIETFDNNKYIDNIIIVSNLDYIDLVENLLLKNKYKKNIKIIKWWKTRQESSYSALLSLEWSINENDNILFTDAVRPFVDDNIIDNVIEALNKYNVVDTAIDVADTIIKVNKENIIEDIPNRTSLKRWQTPQWFKYWLIYKAHKLAIEKQFNQITDDCWLILHFFPDKKMYVIEWSEKNIKITYPLDIYIANNLIQLWNNIKEIEKIDFQNFKNQVFVIFWYTSWIWKSIFDILKKNNIKVYWFSKSTWTDITKIEDINKALNLVKNKEWKIDNIVNTAWILIKEKLENMKIEDIINQININYIWSVLIARQSIQYLEKTKWNLLLFGSSSYSRWRAFYSIYSSTKSALINFTQALAEEVINKWIKVNIINPERTLTKMRIQNFWKEDNNTLLNPENVAEISINMLNNNLTWQIIDVKVSDFRK